MPAWFYIPSDQKMHMTRELGIRCVCGVKTTLQDVFSPNGPAGPDPTVCTQCWNDYIRGLSERGE